MELGAGVNVIGSDAQLKVLMLRGWELPTYESVPSSVPNRGLGGTELQLLLQARALADSGHEVTVIGTTSQRKEELGIRFLPPPTTPGTLVEPSAFDLVFTNVSNHLDRVRTLNPSATIVQVCQNGPDLSARDLVDLFAFVGDGQFAYYSVKHRRLRHKFVLLPNVVSLQPSPSEPSANVDDSRRRQVVWVGGLSKQGLRRWGRVMERVMSEDEGVEWLLCAPAYSRIDCEGLPPPLRGLDLPSDRVQVKNLAPTQLAAELRRSTAVIASLGGEDGPVSYLDGHAAGVPVLCADDIYGYYWNPAHTGLRCSTDRQCYEGLKRVLVDSEFRRELGGGGMRFAEALGEERQRIHLEAILTLHRLRGHWDLLLQRSRQSDRKHAWRYFVERLDLKVRGL